jgi:hypothetical protein
VCDKLSQYGGHPACPYMHGAVKSRPLYTRTCRRVMVQEKSLSLVCHFDDMSQSGLNTGNSRVPNHSPALEAVYSLDSLFLSEGAATVVSCHN